MITLDIAGPSTPDEIAPSFNDTPRPCRAGRPVRYEVDHRGY